MTQLQEPKPDYIQTALNSVRADILELSSLMVEDWEADVFLYDKVLRWKQETWDRMERILQNN